MGGAVGSTFGNSSLLGIFWLLLWLAFGPGLFLTLLFSSRRFPERTRNMWLTAGVTIAPFLFMALGRALG
jgi:hypothetical protein